MPVVITDTEQAVYPVRVLVALTGLTLGDQVDVYRQVSGVRTLLRGGSTAAAVDTSFAVVDAELPFGVPVTYVAVVEGFEYATAPASHTLVGGKVVLSDPIQGLASEVVILNAGNRGRGRNAAMFAPAGRNVMVSEPLAASRGQYELFVDTETGLNNFERLIENATQGIVQIRQPGGYPNVDAYLAVPEYEVGRWSQDGSDPRRRIVMTYAEVEPWAAALTALGWTYGDVEGYYTGSDYATAEADYPTYLAALQGDYS
jgi:hypothetical protein